jgi:hypothetical protein
MDRRHFIAGLVSTGAIASLPGRAAGAAGPAIDVVERFGFSPDGRTDNYDAFHRWGAYANSVRGGNYVFPPGTYYVGRHRTKSLARRDPSTVINPMLLDCDGLTISGRGARIRLSGKFHRSARRGADGQQLGRNMALFMPFELHLCRNVAIRGFEIDGGVREMTRDAEVSETYAALIALNGCSNVTLEDLDLHHCQTDGVYLAASMLNGRRPGIACRDVVLNRVRSHNNARGGLGVIQVYGLTCTDCAFDQNGEGLGRYAPHAPRFGVDVEPDYWRPADVDIKTGNIEFRRCSFIDNGSAVLAAYPERFRGYLRVIDCRSSNRGGAPYHIIVNWPGALIEGGSHDTGAGALWASWNGEKGGDLIIRDCEIRTSGLYGLFHSFPGNIVRVEGVKLVGTHRAPGTHGVVLGIQGDPGAGRRNSVRRCDVFVPAARKSRDHVYDYEVRFQHTISEDNLFRTDLTGAGGEHFCTDYSVGATARRDRYQGAFRPSHNSTHDNRLPFSKG